MNIFKFSIIGLGFFTLIKTVVGYNNQMHLVQQGVIQSPNIATVLNGSVLIFTLFILLLMTYGVIRLFNPVSDVNEEETPALPETENQGFSRTREKRFSMKKQQIAAMTIGALLVIVTLIPVFLIAERGLDLSHPKLMGVFLYPTIGFSVAAIIIFVSFLKENEE